MSWLFLLLWITGIEKGSCHYLLSCLYLSAKEAKEALDAGLLAEISFTVDKYGNNLAGISKIEPTERQPGEDG